MAKNEKDAPNVIRPMFGRPTTEPPELAMEVAEAEQVRLQPDGSPVDLAGQPTVTMLFGAGRSGKSMLARWAVERALIAGRPVAMASMDHDRPTLRNYFADTSVPKSLASAPQFLEDWVSWIVEQKATGLIDFRADDTIAHAPGLIDQMIEAGVHPVVLYLLTPREADLTVLHRMEAAGARSPATGLILNIGTSDVSFGPKAEASEIIADFARITRHSVFRKALDRGAVKVWMPRLFPAKQIEALRLSFLDAATITTGDRRLGFSERVSLTSKKGGWMPGMDEQFAPVIKASWLP